MGRRKIEKPVKISSKRAKLAARIVFSDDEDEEILTPGSATSNSVVESNNPMDEIFKAAIAGTEAKQLAADEHLESIAPKRLQKTQKNIPRATCQYIEVYNKKINRFQQGIKDANAVIVICQQQFRDFQQLAEVCKENVRRLEAKKIDSGSDHTSSGDSPVDNSKMVESKKQQGSSNNGEQSQNDQLTNAKMTEHFRKAFEEQAACLGKLLRQFEWHMLGKIEQMVHAGKKAAEDDFSRASKSWQLKNKPNGALGQDQPKSAADTAGRK